MNVSARKTDTTSRHQTNTSTQAHPQKPNKLGTKSTAQVHSTTAISSLNAAKQRMTSPRVRPQPQTSKSGPASNHTSLQFAKTGRVAPKPRIENRMTVKSGLSKLVTRSNAQAKAELMQLNRENNNLSRQQIHKESEEMYKAMKNTNSQIKEMRMRLEQLFVPATERY